MANLPAAILFDFDGTIAETERLGHRVAYNAAFAQLDLGWIWDETLYGELLAIGGGKERIAHYIERFGPPNVPDGNHRAFIDLVHQRKQQLFTPLAATIRLRPGITRLVAEARADGVPLAIATTAAQAGVDAVIGAHAGLRAAFAVVAAGDIVARKKPAPDVYRYVLERLGVAAGTCIAIEDSAIGTRSAVSAGIPTLVTISDYTRDEDFTGAAAVVTSLGEFDAPAQTLAGRGPANGVVNLPYLRGVLTG